MLARQTTEANIPPFHMALFVNFVTIQGGGCFPVMLLAESLRIFSELAMGETAAPACFSRENAEGEGMPPLLTR